MSKFSILSLTALVLIVSVSMGKANRFILPGRAKILIASTAKDSKNPTSESCRDFRVSEKELRKMFATFRELSAREVHDDYLWVPCYVDGTIEVSKKSFTFRVRPGNTLETNFPAGKSVILGGQQTDSPST